jgi:Flp pilus assembly pilin Flp
MGRILPDGLSASSDLTPTNSSTPLNGSMKMFWRFLTGESGVAAVEDCLIAAGTVLAIIAIVNGIGANLNTSSKVSGHEGKSRKGSRVANTTAIHVIPKA